MKETLLSLIPLITPAAFIVVALASWFQSGSKPKLVKALSIGSSAISILIAALSGFFVFKYGLLETELLGVSELGFSIRLDSLSVTMFGMIALLSFIILKFSLNYLDGDDRQGAFIGRLAATIASVQLLVLSGNLGLLVVSWVLTSICLHRLLVFYPNRPGAQIAARKKFIVARMGDACLLIASVTIYLIFDTGNLELIFDNIRSQMASGSAIPGMEAPALFLVLAAVLKSAQFPTHGWLIEVMETPTPVSALLHAGLLNAGPFLIIRMAYIMEAAYYAPLVLIIIGGLTALFGSIVFLTQTSVKTALGYSSVAHMGFSLMVCGLGVYPAAMLHLVAHSFYKGHAFLSTGSAIDLIRGNKVSATPRVESPLRIILGIALATGVYTGFAYLWSVNPADELALLAIGAIIVLGLSRLFTSAIGTAGSFSFLMKASLQAVMVALAFFTLESASHYLLSTQVPDLVKPDLVKTIIMGVVLLAFGLTVYLQIAAPLLAQSTKYQNLAIHFRNGLYANALFDRMVRALHLHSFEAEGVVTIQNKELQSEELPEFSHLNNRTA